MMKVLNNKVAIAFCAVVLVLLTSYAHAQQTSIDNGLFYLYSNQNQDGSWGGTATSLNIPLQTTATTAKTLQLMGVTDISLNNALGFLSAQTPNSVDDLSLKIETLTPTGAADVTTLVSSIKSAQQTDGGFGIDLEKEYTSDTIDTLSALHALEVAGQADTTTASTVINFLLAGQNTDGGWGIIKGNPSEIFYTSLAFLVLNDFKRSFNLTSSLSSASSYLISRQNLDGSFGNSIFETALSFQALTRSTLDLAIRSAAISYLTSTQLADGSWDEDPYSTALALRALSDSGIISSAQINPINLTKVIDGISQPATSYSAYETMNIGVTTADPDALLEVTVQDSSGTVFSTRTEGGEIFFDTQNLAPGTYTIIVMATDQNTGIIIDEEQSTFTIEASIAISDAILVIAPISTHIGATETVSLALSFSNRSNTQATLTIEYEIKSPSGAILSSGMTPLTLSPETTSTTVTLITFSHSFTESGEYPIIAKVLNGTVLLSTANSAISAAPLVRIDPTKTISPTTVTPDGDKRIRINIHLEGVEQKP
ncbi:MAG: terpene cyclase/mutase family protein [Nitrospirae bacterium]|nr:terpene cyclase/mutase family protein [Nitrospirota bacterium]